MSLTGGGLKSFAFSCGGDIKFGPSPRNRVSQSLDIYRTLGRDMKVRLSLSQKGLILIMVPLLFQLALIWVLGYFYLQAESSAAEAERSKKIEDNCDKIERMGIELYDLIDNGAKKEPESRLLTGEFRELLQEKSKETARVFSELKRLVEENPGDHTVPRNFGIYKGTAGQLAKSAESLEIPDSVDPGT